MAQATLEISKDNEFFRIETSDTNWDIEQIEEGGVNLLYGDPPEVFPAYIVITEDFTGTLPKNKIYQLVPIDTQVIRGVDFEEEDEEEEEPAG